MQKALPEEWKWVKLGEVANCLDGQRKPINEVERENRKGHIPYYGANGQVGWIDDYLFDQKLLLIAEDGGYWCANEQSSYIINGKSWVNNHAHVLAENGKALLEFLNCYLFVADLSKHISGTTRGKLNKQRLLKIQIPLPPLPIQHKIVEILEEADNLRKFRQQADEKMKDLIPSLFVQMFGDPATNPKGWEKKKLKDVTISIKNGLFKRPNEFGSGVPLINVVDLFAEYKVDLTKLERVLSTEKEIKKYLVEEGDLFFCRSSLKKEGVAKCAVALDLNEPTVFECHTILVRLNKKALNPLFASIYLNHPGVRTYTVNTSQTATMTTVGQKDILRQKFFLPPLPLQQEFVRLIEDIEADKTRQAESRKKLDELFNSLMQRAFTGELVA